MNSGSDTDEELPLDSTDILTTHTHEDFVPASIDIQPTDAVRNLLAQARDSQDTGDVLTQLIEPSEADHSSSCLSSELADIYDDGSVEPNWLQHTLHVFVLSEAGKPIYSRYGDEGHLASIMGVMQALVSFVATTGDELQSIEADGKTFVFLSRPHLILVAVGQTLESRGHLVICLSYVYNQILSLLTLKRLKQRFEFQKNLDLRRLLTGDSRLISSIVEFAEHTLGAFLQAIAYLPMIQHVRDQITQIIVQSVKSPTLVFCILSHRKHVVTLVSMKGQTLLPMDLHLVLNLLSNSEQLKSGQTYWLPICLPQFDANGFMYALISYLDEATSLVFLSVDSTEFYALDEMKTKVFERLRSTNNGELLRAISTATFPSLSEIAVPELRHVVCKLVPISQYVSTDWAPLYVDHFVPATPVTTDSDRLFYPLEQFASNASQLRLDVLRTYRRIHSRLHNPDFPTRFIFQTTPTEAFAAWKIDEFEFYCTLEPLTSKSTVAEIRKTLLRWIQSRKTQAFMLSSPTF